MIFLSGTDYIHAKQVREKEKLKASETKKRLRDLSVIMGMKKDFIKELVKTGASRLVVVCKRFLGVLLVFFFPLQQKRSSKLC